MRLAIVISIILAGCSSRSSEEKRNYEAIILHNSMMEKANEIEHRLNELRDDTSVSKDSVAILFTALEQWKADLVEVAGSEEHSHDHQGHSHQCNAIPNVVTEQQQLKIQKELDERLSRIGTRISHLKPETNDQEHIH